MAESIPITVKKVVEKGVIKITINEESRRQDFFGRTFVGITCAKGDELYEENMTNVLYGSHEYPEDLPVWAPSMSPEEIAKVIIQRIHLLRAWVTQCKIKDGCNSGTITLYAVFE